ncbi:drug resistance transporter, EmrB/QacA subfamily [Mycolicibacterium rhodesiae NBB3]|uniref:Drug resistance transporter, EmrB/QacA subfamily n=1 Tax=Mycolicibacterium rhodesiae (strain NBB3) TaxID=710685 RepID=G8RVJ1_MYCRN|nr:DHA2 family efflux MFS transporter permease subunit [Mycolicibacterium rhodesiae]AEV74238.1 drug resistance transporter, EmrB/QacA subfamily [Mycolicibacterium rhodesiae NBB3]
MYQTLNSRTAATADPWHALWAMLVGFFMILVDSTIVSVANPSIMTSLGASYDSVIWVTSAYLLAYAVPLLVAGRLGDQFGPKNLYLLGLTVFTAASLWCGLADSIGTLIVARVVQGLGAALLTPQTLSTITRIFPAERRGVAMSLWGATAGVATLVGPLAGGVLVDGLGWQWIFFVNVPVGIIGVAMAVRLIPQLETRKQRFDLPGMALSGIGMFMIVFALQEGQAHHWAPWVWGTIAGGIGFMAAFLFWQYVNPNDPLVPLYIFRDRDFSLCNIGVATIGFVVTAMIVPVMFYAQAVCGLSPTRSALVVAPMAVASGALAPLVGRIVDRSHPRPIIGFGFSLVAISMLWLSVEMTPTTPIWRIVLPLTVTGVGMAFIWSPLAATATRNLPPDLAGAGSGVYNTTRQVGTVLGSAGVAAFMTWRISDQLPSSAARSPGGEAAMTILPTFLRAPFSEAMSQTLLMPAFFALFGVGAALFLLGFGNPQSSAIDDRPGDDRGEDEGFADDHDDYVEYTVSWDDAGPIAWKPADTEPATEPMASRTPHLLHAPADVWHDEPVESWRHETEDEPTDDDPRRDILEFLRAEDRPVPAKPAGFAHNGFHVKQAESSTDAGRHSRHRLREDEHQPHPFWFESGGRHSRDEPDDVPRPGRHSTAWRD